MSLRQERAAHLYKVPEHKHVFNVEAMSQNWDRNDIRAAAGGSHLNMEFQTCSAFVYGWQGKFAL